MANPGGRGDNWGVVTETLAGWKEALSQAWPDVAALSSRVASPWRTTNEAVRGDGVDAAAANHPAAEHVAASWHPRRMIHRVKATVDSYLDVSADVADDAGAVRNLSRELEELRLANEATKAHFTEEIAREKATYLTMKSDFEMSTATDFDAEERLGYMGMVVEKVRDTILQEVRTVEEAHSNELQRYGYRAKMLAGAELALQALAGKIASGGEGFDAEAAAVAAELEDMGEPTNVLMSLIGRVDPRIPLRSQMSQFFLASKISELVDRDAPRRAEAARVSYSWWDAVRWKDPKPVKRIEEIMPTERSVPLGGPLAPSSSPSRPSPWIMRRAADELLAATTTGNATNIVASATRLIDFFEQQQQSDNTLSLGEENATTGGVSRAATALSMLSELREETLKREEVTQAVEYVQLVLANRRAALLLPAFPKGTGKPA